MTDTHELAKEIYIALLSQGDVVESHYETVAERAFKAAEAFASVELNRAKEAAKGKFKPMDPPSSFSKLGKELG